MITEFVADLARLRQEAGQPSLRKMAGKGHYSHTALSSVLSGQRLPSRELTMAFVRACDGDESEWRARWEREHALLNPLPAPVVQPAAPAAKGRPRWWKIVVPVALSALLATAVIGYLANRPGTPVAAPAGLDGTDPQEQHCQADAVSVHTEPIPDYGSLTLRHSPHCGAVWPLYVSTEQVPAGVTISLRATRPADGAESRFDYPYVVQHQVYSVFGNILTTGRGCVMVTVEITAAAGVLARAATPCLAPA
jgi:hypothetical protein